MIPTHPRAREVHDYLVTARVHLEDAVRSVPEDRRDQRPAPEKWSVAEVLEHLSRVNHGIAKFIARRVTEGRTAGLGPDGERTSILWTLDVARVLNRGERLESPDRSRPADGLALSTLSHPHPAFGPLNLYQWVAFAAAHEFRHAAQIRECQFS